MKNNKNFILLLFFAKQYFEETVNDWKQTHDS